jgi:hypothetical protein
VWLSAGPIRTPPASATGPCSCARAQTIYPDTTADGSLIYTGTNMVFEHTGLNSGETNYYTLFVSQNGTFLHQHTVMGGKPEGLAGIEKDGHG